MSKELVKIEPLLCSLLIKAIEQHHPKSEGMFDWPLYAFHLREALKESNPTRTPYSISPQITQKINLYRGN